MFDWPALELTDEERESVDRYASENGKPGVLKRTYRVGTFCPSALPQLGQLAPRFKGKVQTGRRSRVFGLTFTGNLGSWFLQIKNAPGELVTGTTDQTLVQTAPGQLASPPEGCLVSSMIPGLTTNAESWRGEAPPEAAQVFGVTTEAPMILEPNIILYPADSLFFTAALATNWQLVLEDVSGEWSETLAESLVPWLNMTIGVHVWEFPGMTGDRKGKKS